MGTRVSVSQNWYSCIGKSEWVLVYRKVRMGTRVSVSQNGYSCIGKSGYSCIGKSGYLCIGKSGTFFIVHMIPFWCKRINGQQ